MGYIVKCHSCGYLEKWLSLASASTDAEYHKLKSGHQNLTVEGDEFYHDYQRMLEEGI